MCVAWMGYYVYFALIQLDGWIIKSSDRSGSELTESDITPTIESE